MATKIRLHTGEYCIECGDIATDTHHCMPGSNRQMSETYGLTVRLCRRCHGRIHDRDNALMLKYKRLAQMAFEYKYDRAMWMREFGKNYL